MNKYFWGPTYEEMLHPDKQTKTCREKAIKAQHDDPLSEWNLFNINWRDSKGKVRHVVLPSEISNIDAKIVILLGRDFPTGSHKVGATYSCCVEYQALGKIEPSKHRLVWPSTGNYGVGGAYVGPRMGYKSVVLLPEQMSQERFDLIKYYGADYIKTPGCESNVKEIFDKSNEMSREPGTIVVNQFAEFANYRFHYYVTGNSILELFDDLKAAGLGIKCAGFVSAMGSAGTIAAGERLKQVHPDSLIIGLEPVQCPTLYNNGFGGHDIQGIGDKHVTFIHNTDQMDAIACIDEWDCKNGMELFWSEAGQKAISDLGVSMKACEQMKDMFGISCVCNMLGAIKAAKHYRLTKDDILFTVATDSTARYMSVLKDMEKRRGKLTPDKAHARIDSIFHKQAVDYIREGTVHAKDCWANLKYYTWVEQQGKDIAELRAQRNTQYWLEKQSEVAKFNQLIKDKRGF